jgi:tetratricopeptide (TPR) repeat protein
MRLWWLSDFGVGLYASGDLPGAIAAFRTAIGHNPHYARPHNNLGLALHASGDLPAAIAAFRTATALVPEFAVAHYNLGQALLDQGAFGEARDSSRRALQLLPANHPLLTGVSQLDQRCEKMLELDRKLTAVRKGQDKPADAAEALALAKLCQQPYKALNDTAARLYAEALTADPRLADDLRAGHRYDAACNAVLAAAGKGKDADKPDDTERTRLRRQALDWLRADLTAWARLLADKPQERPVVRQKVQQWKRDADLASVRDPEAVANLPAAEREPWRKLWADVDDLLARAAGKP